MKHNFKISNHRLNILDSPRLSDAVLKRVAWCVYHPGIKSGGQFGWAVANPNIFYFKYL
jgi:hypothetical protein